MEFVKFSKIPRLNRDCTVTEKLDGTNAGVLIVDGKDPLGYPTGFAESMSIAKKPASNLFMFAASRTRWILPDDDNYGFARWVMENQDELWDLGPGLHHGEWWGRGIQRNYGLKERFFSLFNVSKWTKDTVPPCCKVVPVLYEGPFATYHIDEAMKSLKEWGSRAVPGWTDPEGLVVYHHGAGGYFKATVKDDEKPKGQIPQT